MGRVMTVELTNKYYPNRVIYQIEAPKKTVEARLLERQAAGQPLGTRLTGFDEEKAAGRTVADRVFSNNSDLKSVVASIKTAIKADFAQN